MKLRPYCPECNIRIVTDGPQKSTRSQSKASTQAPDLRNTAADTSMLSQSVVDTPTVIVNSNESLKDMISSIVTAQQSQLLSALSAQISQLVEINVQACFTRQMN